jgi:hypothetical protein
MHSFRRIDNDRRNMEATKAALHDDGSKRVLSPVLRPYGAGCIFRETATRLAKRSRECGWLTICVRVKDCRPFPVPFATLSVL